MHSDVGPVRTTSRSSSKSAKAERIEGVSRGASTRLHSTPIALSILDEQRAALPQNELPKNRFIRVTAS